MKGTILSLTLMTAFLIASCSLLKQDPKNPIFSGTTFIDGCSPTGIVNTSFPDFKWNSPGSAVSYEVVGVFNAPIQVSGKQITSTNECIAMWTTGMSGSAGTINFSTFQKVVNGALTSTQVGVDATILSNGTFYWAVWAYDSGMKITYSSGSNKIIR